MPIPKYIKKRDGKTTRLDSSKIRNAIFKAASSINLENAEIAVEKIFLKTLEKLENFEGGILEIDEIEDRIFEAAREAGFSNVGNSYKNYRDKRAEVRKLLSIQDQNGKRSTTDAALLIESDSQDTITFWDRKKIALQLEEEAGLENELAKDISKKVENVVFDLYLRGIRRLDTTDIRSIVDLVLRQESLDNQRKKQVLLGIPSADLNAIVFSRSKENSNIASNNPEAVNLEIAERIQKPWALANIFSDDVTLAHLSGAIHLHDLGYPTRVYCSSHSVEYLKKYGLNKILANLESKSNPPNSAPVLNQHVQTFLASMQAHYAGALGFGFLNIFYAPLLNRPVDVVYGKLNGVEMSLEKNDLKKLVEQGVLSLDKEKENYFEMNYEKKEMREVSKKEYDQVAQNLIFAASQNAFSRGGQTLFIDFNIHAAVPHYLKKVPAVGPGGKYMIEMPDKSVLMAENIPRVKTEDSKDPSNGDADDLALEGQLAGGHIITYGDLEASAQKFAKSMIEVWMAGDKDGRPFHFPKCDLHVDKTGFQDPAQMDILRLAAKTAAKNGSVYFMFDRGDGAVLAQCCRLRERIEDPALLKYPERLRFTGFQNVTINLSQASYPGKNLEGTLREITRAMEIALKAHHQKAKFMKQLLETDGSPMRNLGKPSEDGTPYVDLRKSTYIIGVCGLNEAVQVISGKQLHESEEAYRTGLLILAHMYGKTQEFKEKTGLKFVIEETPAESTTRRFAKVDWNHKIWGEAARKVIKGTKDNPYYTNSIHAAPDADISMIDRIEMQSRFHEPFIQAGAIIHDYLGEQRPEWQTILSMVKNAMDRTNCSQLVFSPTFTECGECGQMMAGEKELCINGNCRNHSESSLNKETLKVVTKIVGYNSVVANWNGSQKQIYADRKRAEKYYGNSPGREMNWLYNPNGHDKLRIIQFGKHGCENCEKIKKEVNKLIEELELNGKVEFNIYYLDETNNKEGLVEAAMYNIPFDSVPSIVVTGKNSNWKKTWQYGVNSSCENGACSIDKKDKTEIISADEIRQAIYDKLKEYSISMEVVVEN